MPPESRPVHRTILVFDVAGFGDHRRTNQHQVTVRAGMYRTIEQAFRAIGVEWAECDHEDRGDGVYVLAPPEVAKEQLVDALPIALVNALDEHNATHTGPERIRMRMAVHAGEVNYDAHGSTSTAINLAFRILDAAEAKRALADSAGVLVVIASEWIFNEVIKQSSAGSPESYKQIAVNNKETETTAWILLPEPVWDSQADPVADVPHQIRGPLRYFAGRERELFRLSEAVRGEAGRRAIRIVSIAGMGGMGKTFLAMHWAHRNRHRFPDGELYVNLRGFDPSSAPLSTEVAVRGFLDALRLQPGSIPVDTEAQAALYRSLAGAKRMLILLDNARDSDQVVPLLPVGSSCTVLVTSRTTLSELVTAYGAQPITLHELDRDEARDLLVSRVGRDRTDAEPEAVEELIEHCAGLPLALSITAANAAIHPSFRLADLARELSQESDRLNAFDGGELRTNLRAVLSSSYRALGPEEAETFRLLGVAPGPDIGLAATAALISMSPSKAAVVLRRLENAHLVLQHTPGRYRMHDLVRLYARESAANSGEAEAKALCRLIAFYLHAAYAGERLLYPHRKPIDVGEPPEDFTEPATLSNDAAILDWFHTEHPCLLAAQAVAVKLGWHTMVWQLAWSMHGYLWRRGHLHDQLGTWRHGLQAAEALDDLPVQALAHRLLGQASSRAGLHNDGVSHLRQAVELAQTGGDIHGEARAYYDLGRAWGATNDERALKDTSRALELFRQLDNPVWEAEALGTVGWHQAKLGLYKDAVDSCRRALILFTEGGNRQGQATTLDCLGYIAHHTGDHTLALEHYRQSLALCRDLGATYDEADTLEHLGQAHAALNQRVEARAAWQQALELNRAQRRTADVIRIEQQMTDLHYRMK